MHAYYNNIDVCDLLGTLHCLCIYTSHNNIDECDRLGTLNCLR